jgi:hypothetical protein
MRYIFIFLFIFAVIPGPTLADEKPVGKIISISGVVKYLPVSETPVAQAQPGEAQKVILGEWMQVKLHQVVHIKDHFETFRKSRVKILFGDNSLIALGPNSRFKVESYLYKPEDKLRQGVLNLSHGLSMYLINKSQTNKNSFFRIVTPTANIAARGTHGFVSATDDVTFVANQAGAVEIENIVTTCARFDLPKKICEEMGKYEIESGKFNYEQD